MSRTLNFGRDRHDVHPLVVLVHEHIALAAQGHAPTGYADGLIEKLAIIYFAQVDTGPRIWALRTSRPFYRLAKSPWRVAPLACLPIATACRGMIRYAVGAP